MLKALCVFALALALVACGGNDGDDGSPGVGQPTAAGQHTPAGVSGDGPGSPAAVERYGYGPSRSGDITYQPDVVLIEGGPDAIRASSEDGLEWAIDARAAGVDELAPRKVMFAASQAAGRVVEVKRSGNVAVVTLAPVELTEIIRDGRITIDQPVSLDGMTFKVVDLPGAWEDISPDAQATPQDTSSLLPGGERYVMDLGPGGPAPGALPNQLFDPNKAYAKVGDWDLMGYKTAGKIGFTANHGVGGLGLKAGIDVYITVGDLSLFADVPIANGQVGQSVFRLEGVTGIGIDIAAGAAEGLSDNRQVKMEVPIELSEQIWVGGFPVTLKQKFRLLVQTAFTAKNGNMSAGGYWRLDGPLGYDGETLMTPTMTTEKSIIESIQGVSVGVNGVVVAAEFRFSAGIGLPVASAGPYAAIVASTGLVNGSSLGIVQCRQATLVLTLRGGVGISVSTWVSNRLGVLLGVKVPAEKQLAEQEIFKQTQVMPDVLACRD